MFYGHSGKKTPVVSASENDHGHCISPLVSVGKNQPVVSISENDYGH